MVKREIMPWHMQKTRDDLIRGPENLTILDLYEKSWRFLYQVIHQVKEGFKCTQLHCSHKKNHFIIKRLGKVKVLLCCDAADKRFCNFSRTLCDRHCRDWLGWQPQYRRPRCPPSSVDCKISSWQRGTGSWSRIPCLAQSPFCPDTNFRRHLSKARMILFLRHHLELEPK